MYSQGNLALLQLEKTAFICSQRIVANAVLKCYDWAIAQREANNCVIGGFHSSIEQEVLHFLLKGKQPVIIVLARGLKQQIAENWQIALNENRLLIVSDFPPEIKRITKQTSYTRNQLVLSLADKIVVGYAHPKGNLVKQLNGLEKPIAYLEK